MLAGTVLAAALLGAVVASSLPPPHIVMIVVDDLGIDDTSIRVPNATSPSPNGVLTPHIESLAADGVLLTAHYQFKFCSPSRTQLLTGRYAYHIGQQSYMNLNPEGARCGVNTSYSFLPQVLRSSGSSRTRRMMSMRRRSHRQSKDIHDQNVAAAEEEEEEEEKRQDHTTGNEAGAYWCAGFGKWHQGFFRRSYTPTARGFDRFVGFYTGGETYRTHISTYGVLHEPGVPLWWTPDDNTTHPSRGCHALWDIHNDSSTSSPPLAHSGSRSDDAAFAADAAAAAAAAADATAFARRVNGTYSTDLTAIAFEAAVSEWQRLQRANGRPPFFAYVAFHGVHLPLEPKADVVQRYVQAAGPGRQPFGGDRDRLALAAGVTAVDDAIGRVLSKLRSVPGMWESTVLLLTSDNGAPVCVGNIPRQEGTSGRSCGGSNGLLRGSKMTDWEGGVRGYAVLAGGNTAVLPAHRRGATWGGLVSQVDWYAAFARLAGVPDGDLWHGTGPVPPDSVPGMLEAIVSGGPSPRTEVVHNIFGDEPGAIRVGDFKLVRGDPNKRRPYNGYNGWGGRGGTNATLPACAADGDDHDAAAVAAAGHSGPHRAAKGYCLFDVVADPTERHDLADERPDVAARLLARYEELRRTEVSVVESRLCPPDAPAVNGCDANRGSGVWLPWLS